MPPGPNMSLPYCLVHYLGEKFNEPYRLLLRERPIVMRKIMKYKIARFFPCVPELCGKIFPEPLFNLPVGAVCPKQPDKIGAQGFADTEVITAIFPVTDNANVPKQLLEKPFIELGKRKD